MYARAFFQAPATLPCLQYPGEDYAALAADQEPIGNDSNILVEISDGDEESGERIDRT